MLDADVLDDLARYAEAGTLRLEEPARLLSFWTPARLALGKRAEISWTTEDCAYVVLNVPGQASMLMLPNDSYRFEAEVLGQIEISLELWSESDNAIGFASTILQRCIRVEARPLELRINQPELIAPPNAPVQLSWAVRNASAVHIRHRGRLYPTAPSGSMTTAMPVLHDRIDLVATGEDGCVQERSWLLTPQVKCRWLTQVNLASVLSGLW